MINNITGLDIACYLGATLFREEFNTHNSWNIDDKKFVTFETLNLIVYYIDLEFYRKYGISAVDYNRDLLINTYQGPMYKSISDEMTGYSISTNFVQKLGKNIFREKWRHIFCTCKRCRQLKHVINYVYAYLYDGIGNMYNKDILIDNFKRTKLYVENHSEHTYLNGVFTKELNDNLKNLNFLSLAFKEEYNPILYRQVNNK